MNDIEAICRLKARYFRTLETRDWQGFRDVFTSDVVVDTTDDGGERVSGVEVFMTYLHENLAGATTVHQGHMPEIDVLSESTAAGIWAMSDMVIWTNGMRLDGYGHHHEFYVKAESQWRIKSLTLTRLYTEFSDPGRRTYDNQSIPTECRSVDGFQRFGVLRRQVSFRRRPAAGS